MVSVVNAGSVSNYNLRHQPQVLSHPSPVKAREVLTPSKSASLSRVQGHDCDHIDWAATALKVHTRLGASIYRFAMAFSWECDTLRGKTKYNGARDHCGQGKCEAAHASLTPTLYDNKLSEIQKELEGIPYSQLRSISKSYLKQRFALQAEDIQTLSSVCVKTRMDCFKAIVNRLTPQERKGSIIGTQLELLRNATYSNPKASNRVDCYLERSLRKLEDELATQCTESKLTPEQATSTLQDRYKVLLDQASEDLTADQKRIENLKSAWDQLMKSQSILSQGNFGNYLTSVQVYLTRYEERTSKRLPGAPGLKNLMDYLKQQQSVYVLKSILKQRVFSTYEAQKMHLKTPVDAEEEFKLAHLQIQQRLKEVTIQRKEILTSKEEIHLLMKSMFGSKQDAGDLVTPSKDMIATKMIDTLPKLTPSRSDLLRSRRVKCLFSAS